MEKVKDGKDFKIYKKGSGRYAVLGADNKWINAEKKVEILRGAGLIKTPPKKKEAPAAEAEAPKAE